MWNPFDNEKRLLPKPPLHSRAVGAEDDLLRSGRMKVPETRLRPGSGKFRKGNQKRRIDDKEKKEKKRDKTKENLKEKEKKSRGFQIHHVTFFYKCGVYPRRFAMRGLTFSGALPTANPVEQPVSCGAAPSTRIPLLPACRRGRSWPQRSKKVRKLMLQAQPGFRLGKGSFPPEKDSYASI